MRIKISLAQSSLIVAMQVPIMLLSGCGSEDDNLNPPVVALAPVSAVDGFDVIAPDEPGYVDLSYLIESGTAGANVTRVQFESSQGSGQCGLIDNSGSTNENVILGLGFNVTIDGTAICEYTYEVESVAVAGEAKTSASATIMVASSADGNAVLPPISIAMAIDDPVLTTNIQTELGDDFPTGYVLSEDFSVLGDGIVEIDTANFTVSYTPTAEGVSRVVYSLEGEVDGVADIKMGTLDYAISDGLNEAPTAESFTYPDEVLVGTPIEVNVAGYIGDDDNEDNLQLINVQSYTAVVASSSPNDLTNTMFTFLANSYGMHYVTYTVSDHRGGFATAIVEIKIDDPDSVNLWDDVENNLLVFSGSMTVIEADELGIEYQDFFSDTDYYPAVDVTSYTSLGSNDYCTSLGARLPTSDEFKELVEAQDPANNWNWPSGLQYTTTDADGFMSSLLSTGEAGTFSDPSYVTCVSSSELTTSVPDTNIVANGSDTTKIILTFKRSGIAVSDADFFVEVTGNAQLSDDTVTTDLDGTASVLVSNTTAEEVFVSFTYATAQSELISSTEPVTFIGDAETARIATLMVTKNNAFADG